MSEKPVTREELYSAIRVIETTHGFADSTTAVGEAWRVVRIVLSRIMESEWERVDAAQP